MDATPQPPQQPVQPVLPPPPSQRKFPTVVFFILGFLVLGITGFLILQSLSPKPSASTAENNMAASDEEIEMPLDEAGNKQELHPLTIEYLRQQEYPGSDIVIEETLPSGSNYDRYIASYQSDGNKIYALLTVPQGEKPTTGWPVIIFNHGFIPPAEYRTTEKYIAYTDAFSRNGYIVFRSDYRGHGSSEGEASGGYGSNNYTVDVLNAVSSIKKLTVDGGTVNC